MEVSASERRVKFRGSNPLGPPPQTPGAMDDWTDPAFWPRLQIALRAFDCKELNLSGWDEPKELPALGGLTSLEVLELRYCSALEFLPDMAPLTQLRELDLRDCTGLQGSAAFQGLARLEKLRELHLYGCTGLDAQTVRELRRKLPAECRIIGPDGEDVEP